MESQFDYLSDEVIIIIFEKMLFQDMLKCQFVCYNWNEIINDDIVRKNIIDIKLKEKFKKKYIKFNELIYKNYNILRKVNLLFFKNLDIDKPTIISTDFRLIRIFDLQWIVGSKMMLHPHKLKFKIINKIKDKSQFKEIEKINEEFFLIPNSKEIQ